MAEHHPLGTPGGSRGVDQGHQVGRIDRFDDAFQFMLFIRRDRMRKFRQLVEMDDRQVPLADEALIGDDRFNLRDPLPDFEQLLVLLAAGNKHHPAAGMIEHIFNLVRSVGRVHRHRDRPGRQNAHVGYHPARAVLGEDGNPVTRNNSQFAQPPGNHQRPQIVFGVGQPGISAGAFVT